MPPPAPLTGWPDVPCERRFGAGRRDLRQDNAAELWRRVGSGNPKSPGLSSPLPPLTVFYVLPISADK